MFTAFRRSMLRVAHGAAATISRQRVSYQRGEGSRDVPQYLRAAMMELFEERTEAKENGDHEKADFLFREMRREFGVRDIVDTEKGYTQYYIFGKHYAPEDYQEFTRDKEDSLAIPSWLNLSFVDVCLKLYMIAVIKQRNAKYRNRRRRIHSDLELTPNRYLEILSNDYGVLVDIQNKTWHLDEGFVPRTLQHSVLRQELAKFLEKWCLEHGFSRLSKADAWAEDRVGCRIYTRPLEIGAIDPDVGSVTLRIRSSILLYTDEVTKSGEQAIHVYAEYSTRQDDDWTYERVLIKAKKILRVGKLDRIVKRVEDRVQQVEKEAMLESVVMCFDCGQAPLMTSKKGNRVCSHFCWTKSDYKIREFIEEEHLVED